MVRRLESDTRAATQTMPSLFRFLIVVGVLAGIGYGAMYALATFVQPTPREITVSVPPDRFMKR